MRLRERIGQSPWHTACSTSVVEVKALSVGRTGSPQGTRATPPSLVLKPGSFAQGNDTPS